MIANNIFIIVALFCGLLTASAAGQKLKPIYDGRMESKYGSLSSAEETLLKERILPAAHDYWHQRESVEDCLPEFEADALDIAQGSFTKPGAVQKAILYRFCTTGHNVALNGIAVIENGQTLAHIVFEGSWDNTIGALPDVNGNGLSEILITTDGLDQGITWRSVAIIELAGDSVTKFGRTMVVSDNCGADEKHGRAQAWKLYVKEGSSPVFYQETFMNKSACDEAGTWKKSESLKRVFMADDEYEYHFIQ